MIHVPLITPFGTDGRVAAGALERLAHEVLAEGAAGVVALGTTAEVATLDEAERAEVVAVVGRVCRERGARFTVGVGANDTRRAVRELRALAALPVVPDAALVTVPSFVRPGEAGVVAHFAALAGATEVPLFVYHVPYRTGQALSARALRELAAIPGVAGLKHAVGVIDADTVELLGSDLPPGFEVLAGDDVFAPALFALGAAGGILASAHLATARWAELARGSVRGPGRAADRAADGAPDPAARAAPDPALGHRLAALAATLFREPNPAVTKAVLHARGRIPTPDVRLPLLPASAPARDAALAADAAVDRVPAGPARD